MKNIKLYLSIICVLLVCGSVLHAQTDKKDTSFNVIQLMPAKSIVASSHIPVVNMGDDNSKCYDCDGTFIVCTPKIIVIDISTVTVRSPEEYKPISSQRPIYYNSHGCNLLIQPY